MFKYQIRKNIHESKHAPRAAYAAVASVANNCELPLSLILGGNSSSRHEVGKKEVRNPGTAAISEVRPTSYGAGMKMCPEKQKKGSQRKYENGKMKILRIKNSLH